MPPRDDKIDSELIRLAEKLDNARTAHDQGRIRAITDAMNALSPRKRFEKENPRG